MLPGPVFVFELLRSARRGTFYAARAVYATVLVLILWAVHSTWAGQYGGEIPVSMVHWFGLLAFAGIAIGQEFLVLLLTPTLVAGAIADEKRRRTLHYLLASRLSGPEIVLGKLLVRMLYVGVLLGVSFPVMSMLVLVGGLDPMLVVMGCGALQHGVVPGGALDLGLDDRAEAARGPVRHIWPGGALAGRAPGRPDQLRVRMARGRRMDGPDGMGRRQ